MSDVDKTLGGKKRVRLKGRIRKKSDMTKMNEARDKSFAEAPRTESGRIIPGYRYKQILDSHSRWNVEPKVYSAIPERVTNLPIFKRDKKKADKIISLLKKGYPPSVVCRYVNIGYPTFKDWLVKGSEGDPLYEDFYFRVQQAEAIAEMRRLRKLERHERAEWKVNAWLLERRWPERWAKRSSSEVHVKGEVEVNHKQELGRQVLANPEARELARKVLEGDEVGYEVIDAEIVDSKAGK